MTKWVGEGALWVLFPALWVGTPTREPENSHWPERVEQAPGGSVVGTLVKYPGWGGAGAQKAATKATGWLLHRQQRWTKRAEGHGAGLPWQECLLPGGWGAPTSAKDKIRAAWTTPLATLQSEQSRRIGSLLHALLCFSQSPVGTAHSLHGSRALSQALRRGRTLAPTLTCCWPGWPSPPQQLAAASPLGLCWRAASGSDRPVREQRAGAMC